MYGQVHVSQFIDYLKQIWTYPTEIDIGEVDMSKAITDAVRDVIKTTTPKS